MRLADYLAPDSLDEAVALLGASTSSRALAGGHSLLLEPNRSRMTDAVLVDLRRISGLADIEVRRGGVQIGAMTTLAAIANDKMIQDRYSALAEAAGAAGDAQVRNRATIGGNLADANPGADLPAALLALGAELEVRHPSGTRTQTADGLWVGPFENSLRQSEVITVVSLPPQPAQSGSAYEKISHPATLYAICGVAASVTLAPDGTIRACRCAVTGAATIPTTLAAVGQAAAGLTPDAETLATVAEQADRNLTFEGDRFASAEYRRNLTTVLTERALTRAVERATTNAGG
jgi:carbon-monoxide dehydrogenase medium subunit